MHRGEIVECVMPENMPEMEEASRKCNVRATDVAARGRLDFDGAGEIGGAVDNSRLLLTQRIVAESC